MKELSSGGYGSDPNIVIALLDDIEALERERDALSREVEEWRNTLKNRA